MEARQRAIRAPIRRPTPVNRKRALDDDEEEDQKAGRGIIYLLSVVAVAVVLLVFIRSADTRSVREKKPDENVKPFQPSGNTDIKPANTLDESEQVRKIIEEEQIALRESYPIELLTDVNGTQSEVSEEESDEEREQEVKEHEMRAKISESKVGSIKTKAQQQPTSREKRVGALGNILFADGVDFEEAPLINLPKDPDVGVPFAGMWKLLTVHEEYFRTHPHRRYIPRLGETITRQQFHDVFRKTSTPVIIPFEHARALGFVTQATTIDALQKRFPYDPAKDPAPKTYNKYSLTKATVDWGPAVYAIASDAKLEKIAVGVRNFPRNLHMSSRNLAAMGVSRPPYIQKQRLQAASAWFGTTTSDTKFHHDCCDNFVMMIVGTKRWFIAPPTDWRTLRPVRCEGDNQSLCWANVPYPNAKDLPEDKKRIVDALNYIVIDAKAGDMLYLPAGWWHHITNLGPTVMMNHWTYGCENVALLLDLEPSRKDRSDFKGCERNARDEQSWRTRMDAEDFGTAKA